MKIAGFTNQNMPDIRGMPAKLGGLGVTRISEICKPAFIASFAHAQDNYLPFLDWNVLPLAMKENLPLEKPFGVSQHDILWMQHSEKQLSILEILNTTDKPGAAWLLSGSSNDSLCVLNNAFAKTWHTRLSEQAFRMLSVFISCYLL